jgi:hypothetical protein
MMLFYHGGMRIVGEQRLKQFIDDPGQSKHTNWLAQTWELAVCNLGRLMVTIGRRLECYRIRAVVRST